MLKNDAHERFCQEYLVDLNATAAYQRVYPKVSATSAPAAGARLLKNVKVQTRLTELQQARSERTQITADRVITELARIGFSDMRDFTEWGPQGVTLKPSDTLTDDQARCVAEVSETTGEKSGSLRFKLHDKLGALVKLGQHLGVKFVERHEHTGKDGTPLPAPQVVFYSPDNGRGDRLALTAEPNGKGAHGQRRH